MAGLGLPLVVELSVLPSLAHALGFLGASLRSPACYKFLSGFFPSRRKLSARECFANLGSMFRRLWLSLEGSRHFGALLWRLRLSLIPVANLATVFFQQLSMMVEEMVAVGGTGFQVLGGIVCLVSVNVMDAPTIGKRAMNRLPDNMMFPPPSSSIIRNLDQDVPALYPPRTNWTGVRHMLSCSW